MRWIAALSLEFGEPLRVEHRPRCPLQAFCPANEGAESIRSSGRSRGDSVALSEIGVSAKTHGGELLKLGSSGQCHCRCSHRVQLPARCNDHPTARRCENQRVGFLAHELRNALGAAKLAVRALELGNIPIGGATGAVLKRSLDSLGLLITRFLNGVRSGARDQGQTFSLAALIADAEVVATLDARATDCTLTVPLVDPALAVCADRELLLVP